MTEYLHQSNLLFVNLILRIKLKNKDISYTFSIGTFRMFNFARNLTYGFKTRLIAKIKILEQYNFVVHHI